STDSVSITLMHNLVADTERSLTPSQVLVCLRIQAAQCDADLLRGRSAPSRRRPTLATHPSDVGAQDSIGANPCRADFPAVQVKRECTHIYSSSDCTAQSAAR